MPKYYIDLEHGYEGSRTIEAPDLAGAMEQGEAWAREVGTWIDDSTGELVRLHVDVEEVR